MPETAPDIAVIGFGYIGSVIASVLAERGYRVTGIDTNAGLVAEVKAGRCPIPEPGLAELVAKGVAAGRLTASTDPAAARGARAVLITVGTPLGRLHRRSRAYPRRLHRRRAPSPRRPDRDDQEHRAPRHHARHARGGDRPRPRPRGPRPHGLQPRAAGRGGGNPRAGQIPILIGGIDAAAGEAAAAFWREALPVEVMTVSSPEAAEMVKLASNLWIDLNIALANELASWSTPCPGRSTSWR